MLIRLELGPMGRARCLGVYSQRSSFFVAAKCTTLMLTFFLSIGAAQGQPADFAIPPLPVGHNYEYYELGTADIALGAASRLARSAKLVPTHPQPAGDKGDGGNAPITFVDRAHIVRMHFAPTTGSLLWLPDLASLTRQAPVAKDAIVRAQGWIGKSGLLGNAGSTWHAEGVTTLSRQTFRVDGTHQPATRALQTVNFAREIGGLPVEGPDSVMTIDVGAGGIVGVTRILLPIKATGIAVHFKSGKEIESELQQALSQLSTAEAETKVVSSQLIYFEQGGRFVQPAYRFLVSVKPPKGTAIGNRIVIAAADNAPEKIAPLGNSITSSSGQRAADEPLPVRRELSMHVYSRPILGFGFFFDRLDYNEWVSDSWRFWSNFSSELSIEQSSLQQTATASPLNGLQVYMEQFRFDFPWMWQGQKNPNVPNYVDSSNQFVDRAYFAIVDGHGAPLQMVTLQDYADSIVVPQSKGYGAFNGSNAETAFLLWRGCCVVTSPDPADVATCASTITANPAKPWFSLFKGLHGTYGFHSEMTIQSEEGPGFGELLGAGSPVLASWMNSVTSATQSQCATTEYDCASAVIVAGNENDAIYDGVPIQSPQSLTIWWQSPGVPLN